MREMSSPDNVSQSQPAEGLSPGSEHDFFRELGVRTFFTAMVTSGAAAALTTFILSALGALNGLILSSARVPFAMARDGLADTEVAHRIQF